MGEEGRFYDSNLFLLPLSSFCVRCNSEICIKAVKTYFIRTDGMILDKILLKLNTNVSV